MQRRNALHEKKAAGSLTAAEQVELKDVVQEFTQYRDESRRQDHQNILAIRSIMDRYRQDGTLFLGGVSMIADDMISFIKSDLRVFGIAVFLLLVLTIAIIFRRVYWVLLPMLVCVVSIACTVGFLGWFGWEVTVVSSNFISLQLIITLAMTIHLMVRYREFAAEQPDSSQHELILEHDRKHASPVRVFGPDDHGRVCVPDLLRYPPGDQLRLHHGRGGGLFDRRCRFCFCRPC